MYSDVDRIAPPSNYQSPVWGHVKKASIITTLALGIFAALAVTAALDMPILGIVIAGSAIALSLAVLSGAKMRSLRWRYSSDHHTPTTTYVHTTPQTVYQRYQGNQNRYPINNSSTQVQYQSRNTGTGKEQVRY